MNDLCRICKCHLKIEFGSGRVSFENLFKASGRKESKGLILSQAFEIIGLPVLRPSTKIAASFGKNMPSLWTKNKECPRKLHFLER